MRLPRINSRRAYAFESDSISKKSMWNKYSWLCLEYDLFSHMASQHEHICIKRRKKSHKEWNVEVFSWDTDFFGICRKKKFQKQTTEKRSHIYTASHHFLVFNFSFYLFVSIPYDIQQI